MRQSLVVIIIILLLLFGIVMLFAYYLLCFVRSLVGWVGRRGLICASRSIHNAQVAEARGSS